jgi:multiple sugar transport system substrate-binding protein
MIEVEFTYILDAARDRETWDAIMGEFGAQHNVKVKVHQMTWDTAWAELFAYSSGKPPHVSMVGNTWVSSLARLNVLRPFTPDEITAVGGASAFITPNWYAGSLQGDRRVWAIPWTAWLYVVCYRKDLLRQAGVASEGAFGTIPTISSSVRKLSASSLDIPWLNPQLPVSYRDLLHIAASYIWAAGGDIIDAEGTRTLFNSLKAIEGLSKWLEAYRLVRAPYKALSQPEIIELFGKGKAAAILTHIRAANQFMDGQGSRQVRDNLGVAPVTDQPWTGGASFVIWQHGRGDLPAERAAVELVKFLASKEINLRYHAATQSLPSRLDAIEDLYPQGSPIRDAVMQSARNGRIYNNISIWRRIEYQLSEEIGAALDEANASPETDLDEILHTHLDPLAERLNITLNK